MASLVNQTTPTAAFNSFRINTRREGLDNYTVLDPLRQDVGVRSDWSNVHDVIVRVSCFRDQVYCASGVQRSTNVNRRRSPWGASLARQRYKNVIYNIVARVCKELEVSGLVLHKA